ncbi:MAG: iron chelate uptake ABC transporter family permease subunit [Methanomicrobiales archaeon]
MPGSGRPWCSSTGSPSDWASSTCPSPPLPAVRSPSSWCTPWPAPGGRVLVTTLLLSGIAVSAFFSACTSFLLFSSSQNLHQVIFWMMGGLLGRGWEHVYMVLPFAVAGSAILLVHARSLNALM